MRERYVSFCTVRTDAVHKARQCIQASPLACSDSDIGDKSESHPSCASRCSVRCWSNIWKMAGAQRTCLARKKLGLCGQQASHRLASIARTTRRRTGASQSWLSNSSSICEHVLVQAVSWE